MYVQIRIKDRERYVLIFLNMLLNKLCAMQHIRRELRHVPGRGWIEGQVGRSREVKNSRAVTTSSADAAMTSATMVAFIAHEWADTGAIA